VRVAGCDRDYACNASEAEMRKCRATILDFVRRALLDVSPSLNGYVYRFEAISEILSQLARLVNPERQSRAFLTFRIIVEAGQAQFVLEITGSPEAKHAAHTSRGRRLSAVRCPGPASRWRSTLERTRLSTAWFPIFVA